MPIPGTTNAQLPTTHMTFVEVIDPKKQDAASGRVYHVLVNPASYSVRHAACYGSEQPIGGDEPAAIFNKILPGNLAIDLLFDATGSLGASTLNIAGGVMGQVAEFLDMVFLVDKNRKQPKPLHIIWGPMEFYGRARSVDLSYSHFDSFGQPIRAIAKCSFIQDKGIKKPAADSQNGTSAPTGKKIEFNRDKHLVNALLKHGDYLKVLADQSPENLPNSLREASEDLELFFDI